MSASENHPVLAGLAALVGVGLAIGLLLGVITMVGTDVVGLGGESVSVDASAGESLYVPEPSETEGPSGPLITLAPEEKSGQETDEPEESPSKSESAGPKISLQAGQKSVGSMDRIDLTGAYPGGEGAILQVQRRQGGSWEEFPVTASVSNETFSTYVQTGRTGKNKFRMIDSDSDVTSNPVTVTVK